VVEPISPRTVGEALAAFRAANALDPAAVTARTWTCRIGPVRIRLRNFAWRREAILRHDLHHVLTGYPCTMRGECQMATWEFAAGRFPHPAATLFCLPLVLAGLMSSPRATWFAFRRGRRMRSLYRIAVTDATLDLSLATLAGMVESQFATRPRTHDTAPFLLLVLKAVLLGTAPLILAAIIAAIVW
jgi:hypothetical protein